MPGEVESSGMPDDGSQGSAPQPAVPHAPDAMMSGLALLDAIRSNSADPGRTLLGALAGQRDSGIGADWLMKLMAGQSEPETDRIREELREEIRAEQADAIEELSDTARRLFAEREELRRRVEELAAALGACPLCFGDDLLCPTCHGAGEPGARAPDPVAFRRFVVPALDRARAVMRRAAARRPWPQSNPRPPSFDPVTVNRGGTAS
jgi:hypothetical protein